MNREKISKKSVLRTEKRTLEGEESQSPVVSKELRRPDPHGVKRSSDVDVERLARIQKDETDVAVTTGPAQVASGVGGSSSSSSSTAPVVDTRPQDINDDIDVVF